MHRIHVVSILPCLLLGACDFREFDSSDRYQSDFHFSYALNPGGRLEVENFNGSVEIMGWDQSQCDISGSKYASTTEMRDRIKIDVNHTAGGIFVRSVRPAGDFHGNLGVRYVIHVPRKTELSRITSSNGPVHVEDIEGRADLKTSNGSLRVESLRGMLMAHTSNSSITSDHVAGSMTLHTSNGAIRAEHVIDGIEATTSNSSITVHFDDQAPSPATLMKFETNNGRIDLTLPTPPKSEIRAQTSNSSITLRLPANTAARFRAETSHGEVRSDFTSDGPEPQRHGKHQTLETTVGGGGPLIDLHTTNGSIHLLRM
jgi:DUF4097 and DUF4098 domain-containing protein YvlB